MSDFCKANQDTLEHYRQLDHQDAADAAWAKHAEWHVGVLMEGCTVELNDKPYLGPDELFGQMCWDSMDADKMDEDSQHLMNAIKCRPDDEAGCGALIHAAKRVAAKRLIEANDGRLRDQFEEGFMEHYARGAA